MAGDTRAAFGTRRSAAEERLGMSKKRYVILTMTRSGSTWLLTLLNGQPRVAAYEELFLWREVDARYAWVAEGSPPRFFTRRSELPGPRILRLWHYLQEVEANASRHDAVGFKLMLGQLRQAPALLPILLLRRYRLIVLMRDTVFEAAVSRLVLDQTGDAQSREEAARDRRVRLNVDSLLREIRRRKRGLRLLRMLRRFWPWPAAEVGYRDLLANQASAMTRILRTLGLQSTPRLIESPLKRRIRTPYDEFIENFGEIEREFERAGLKDMLPKKD